MRKRQHLQKLKEGLERAIRKYPDGFYDSFEFTKTGNNLTHPWTTGLLAKILWRLPGVTSVGFDVRFNIDGWVKFQPDLVAYHASDEILIVDYESPNSSDARIPEKDVARYLAWASTRSSVPYVIITTLPNRAAPDWQLRYTSKGGCNYKFRHRRRELRRNPARFWYAHYRRQLSSKDLRGLWFLNIDGKQVRFRRLGA